MASAMTGEIDSSARDSAADDSKRPKGNACATCGLDEAEHGIHLIHRFVSTTRDDPRPLRGSPPHCHRADALW